MNTEELVSLTKEFIHNATHYNMEYIDKIYSENLVIVRVDEAGKVDTTNKEQLLGFFQGMRDKKAAPLSEEAVFHYAVADENIAMVVLDRTMDLFGRMEKMFFTLIWEKTQTGWQVTKESVSVLEVLG